MPSSFRPFAPPRRVLPPMLVLSALLFLTGCFTFDTLITVKRDGSGTVDQLFVVTGPMIEMMMMFGGQEGGDLNLCNEDDLRRQAAELGEGVRLLSSERIDKEDGAGCRARYAFDDINTLRVNQDPGNRLPSDPNPEEETPEPEFVTFSFTPGAPSTLVVRLPQNFEGRPEEAENADPFPADSSQRAMQLQMMRQMLKGGRVRMSLNVDGTITQTDATYRDGREVTLVEVDFDELLRDEARLEHLMDANPKSVDEVKALLEDVPGIKVETREEVRVRFE